MDITEFIEREKPSGRKLSRIAPYLSQVLKLKTEGYSDDQIRLFLAENGVRVTQPTVSRFVSKHRDQIQKPVNPVSEATTQKQPVVDEPIKPINTGKSGLSEIGTRLSAKKVATTSIAEFLSEVDALEINQTKEI